MTGFHKWALGKGVQALVVWVMVVMPLTGYTQTTIDSINNGTSWLLSVRYGIGIWALSAPPDPLQTEFSEGDFTPTYIRDSFEAINCLEMVNVPLTEYELTLGWINRLVISSTDLLGQKTRILSRSGEDTTQSVFDILTAYNSDGGFGGVSGSPSDIPDTAYALRAITIAESTNTSEINGAVNYLISRQNSDGGWGFIPGKQSEVYYTALVMQALLTQPQTTTITNALNQGTTFLLAHQNPDGGFGSSPSTVWETAQVFLAISKTTGDAAVRTAAIDYLLGQQQANGSWDDDPYATALALQALVAAQNQTGPPDPPTSGLDLLLTIYG